MSIDTSALALFCTELGLMAMTFHYFWSIGEQENIDKFSKRLVKVTKQHNEECKKLLTLMGVPYIEVLFFP